MNWYLDVLTKKYAEFSGRARRQEFWMFALFNIIASIVLSIIDQVAIAPAVGAPVVGSLYSLAVLIPSIALWVRRLHDTGRSGWWLLIAFVPCVGAIVLLVFAIMDSEPGPNAYGPNPKGA